MTHDTSSRPLGVCQAVLPCSLASLTSAHSSSPPPRLFWPAAGLLPLMLGMSGTYSHAVFLGDRPGPASRFSLRCSRTTPPQALSSLALIPASVSPPAAHEPLPVLYCAAPLHSIHHVSLMGHVGCSTGSGTEVSEYVLYLPSPPAHLMMAPFST